MKTIKALGRIRGLTRNNLTIATDASLDRNSRRVGLGFVASSGHWGILGHRHPHAGAGDSYIAELRAVACAWEWITPGRGSPVTILTDNEGAVDHLNRWSAGDLTMPQNYAAAWRASGDRPTLVVLAEAVHAHPDVTVTWVKSRTGHPLQECADSLARIGYRGRTTSDDARTAGAAMVQNRLADLNLIDAD